MNLNKLVVIFLFLSFAVQSQVEPPELRCIEVLPNSAGVKLTWIPPTDPNNLFSSYEIYHSNLVTGPYVPSGTVMSLSSNTFIVGANSGYFFMLTRFNGGGQISRHTDTLKAIFLNIISAVPDLKLIFNDLNPKKLISSSPNFTVSKEFPIGTWKTLGITTDTKYADTLSVCSASINYQVSLADNFGCVSVSNLQGGVYKDNKAPNQPYIDSISVLPNGNTVLAWKVPRDKDIAKYEIQYKTNGGGNAAIDTVTGRNNTLYTYTTAAADSMAVGLYIKALDSCNTGGSSVDYTPLTMFLKTKYDKCGSKTELSWNKYELRSEDLLEYRIYYSINGGNFIRIGSTTQNSFVHTNADPGKSLSYFVRMVTKDQTVTSSSNRVTFFATQVDAPGEIYIRTVTIQSKNNAFLKIWMDNSKNSLGIDLYRSENGKDFVHVGFINYNGSSGYTFNDEQINSSNSSYYYRAIVRDSCGNARATSKTVQSILLRVQDDKERLFVKHLSWNPYSVFDGDVSGYNIFRIINNAAVTEAIGTTGPQETTFTDELQDEAPKGSKIQYLVQAVEGIGNPRGFKEESLSNRVDVYMEGRLFVPNVFAPSGVNKTWLPIPFFIDKSEYNIKVYNRWGKVVFETSNDKEAWDGANSEAGTYIYLISYKNARGEYKELTGYVMLLR